MPSIQGESRLFHINPGGATRTQRFPPPSGVSSTRLKRSFFVQKSMVSFIVPNGQSYVADCLLHYFMFFGVH